MVDKGAPDGDFCCQKLIMSSGFEFIILTSAKAVEDQADFPMGASGMSEDWFDAWRSAKADEGTLEQYVAELSYDTWPSDNAGLEEILKDLKYDEWKKRPDGYRYLGVDLSTTVSFEAQVYSLNEQTRQDAQLKLYGPEVKMVNAETKADKACKGLTIDS